MTKAAHSAAFFFACRMGGVQLPAWIGPGAGRMRAQARHPASASTLPTKRQTKKNPAIADGVFFYCE
ncbi:hypothetical protein [Janthinobacterium sp.]|uniref:hypothetical protein n=1 Tax=Janthinobacterium sp. TaxID=1871054 RepID=UPI002585602B|nr:hypothetical protein [Janthinobacterium sp.]MCX7293563.1 hypothetical protein [Janthinobacterium sp.]